MSLLVGCQWWLRAKLFASATGAGSIQRRYAFGERRGTLQTQAGIRSGAAPVSCVHSMFKKNNNKNKRNAWFIESWGVKEKKERGNRSEQNFFHPNRPSSNQPSNRPGNRQKARKKEAPFWRRRWRRRLCLLSCQRMDLFFASFPHFYAMWSSSLRFVNAYCCFLGGFFVSIA